MSEDRMLKLRREFASSKTEIDDASDDGCQGAGACASEMM